MKNPFETIWHTTKILGLTWFLLVADHGTAWAQAVVQEKEKSGGSWLLSYGLVALGVGLGMLFVLKSSHRRDRAEPEKYEQKAKLPELEKSREK